MLLLLLLLLLLKKGISSCDLTTLNSNILKSNNYIMCTIIFSKISSLGQHLINDRSYKFFKNEVNSFIRSHNDKLLNQIGLLFSIARSAIKKVGLNTSEGQEVSRNAMKFYEDAYVPLVSQAGGLVGSENIDKITTLVIIIIQPILH